MIRVEAGVVITCPEWNRGCRIYGTVSGVVGVWHTTRRQVPELVGAIVMADGEDSIAGHISYSSRCCCFGGIVIYFLPETSHQSIEQRSPVAREEVQPPT